MTFLYPNVLYALILPVLLAAAAWWLWLSGGRTPHAVFGKHCGHSGCFRKIQFTAECVEKRRTRAECTMVYHFSEYLLIIADISTASSTDVQADTGRHNNLCDISSATGADTAAIDSA